MNTINLALTNTELYAGCEISEMAGRLTLTTPVDVAANHVGRNVAAMIEAIPADQRGAVALTGPMAVWAYLVVFHGVLHKFTRVYYDDGRGGVVCVAAHG